MAQLPKYVFADISSLLNQLMMYMDAHFRSIHDNTAYPPANFIFNTGSIFLYIFNNEVIFEVYLIV